MGPFSLEEVMKDPAGSSAEAERPSRADLLNALFRKACERLSRCLDEAGAGSKAIDDLAKLVKAEKEMPAEQAEDQGFQWVSDEGEAEGD
jgi:hypothetical protein